MLKRQDKYKDLAKGQEIKDEVTLAGRVMSRRVMGKLAFFTIADESGSIQLYLDKAALNGASSSEINLLLPK